ncbi:hypothetical protein WJX73_010787 [Symbiochloris irregularis]|uniref:Uncharacterized protein n=1 Tax=Symbiochloris irregularis TaxID=706552 RepID=A0AAW1PVS0_9CHLO
MQIGMPELIPGKGRCSLCGRAALPARSSPHGRNFRRHRLWAAASSATVSKSDLKQLDEACQAWKNAPPSEKRDFSKDVAAAFKDLKSNDVLSKWGAATESLTRRTLMMNELRMVGIRNPEVIGKATVRNEAAFLGTVVLSSSLIALVAGQLPGDWGFFVPFLVGGSSLVVLAIGSTNPGALGFLIDRFSLVFPDYRERVRRHEAAHFLVGYLMGLPVTRYTLSIGKASTEFVENRDSQILYGRILEDQQVDQYSVLSMAGAASEAMKYEDVQGQFADLSDLQRIFNCAKNKMPDREQQNMTRWAVYQAANLLRQWKKEYEALQDAMSRGDSVADCVAAIEQA